MYIYKYVLYKYIFQGSPVATFHYLQRTYRKYVEILFTRQCGDRTEENSIGCSRKFCTVRLVKYLNRLPREVMNAPSLGVFKATLEGALSN